MLRKIPLIALTETSPAGALDSSYGSMACLLRGLLGSRGANLLDGGGGDDHIEGRGGDDFLDGDDGTDFLDGGDGSDTCRNGETVVNCEAVAPHRTGR
jgi:RTX calcium-binding nonapeptide repeat (4 copies)